ncbi:MAG: cyanophycinase [Planctomycetota bacterium]
MVRTLVAAAILIAGGPCQDSPPTDPPAPVPASIDPRGVRGARIVAGGGDLPEAVLDRFVQLCSGDEARIVIVPTASAIEDYEQTRQRLLERWQRRFPRAQFAVLHTTSREVADRADFSAPLAQATGVWFPGGVQKRLADAYLGTRVEHELMALCARGGAVGGTSAGAAIQSRTMIQEGKDPPIVATGFDLVPGAIVDQHFTQRERLPRLLAALQAHPGHFGLGVDESTAVEVRGRTLVVLGRGTATLALAAAPGRPERIELLTSGASADLVTWQRAARDRALAARTGAPWPPDPMAAPIVPHGTLVLAGGGAVPAAAADRFVAAAGGAEARVVLVPSASPREGRGEDPFAAMLRERGVTAIAVLDAAHPDEVDDAALASLADATGVWFGGGRQWRLCDAFEGTPAIAAFHQVLARGGVVGGSSAGATIQAEFLVRGNPLGNRQEWCEGYDRGFAFLPGCAVDQHFVARDRTEDLQGLVALLPQLIGLGIDEGTAAIVTGSVMEVVGDSKVAVFDVRGAGEAARKSPQPRWLEAGARWDLAAGAPAK